MNRIKILIKKIINYNSNNYIKHVGCDKKFTGTCILYYMVVTLIKHYCWIKRILLITLIKIENINIEYIFTKSN